MPELPTLGAPPKKSRAPAVAGLAALVGLASGAAYWLTHRAEAPVGPPPSPPQASAPAAPSPDNAPAPAPAPAPTAPAPPTPTPTELAAPTRPPGATGGAPVELAGGLKSFNATLDGPLEAAVVAQAGKAVGVPLTQVVTRSLVWWVKVPRDLVRGDVLSVVYEERGAQEPLVHAVRLVSQKLGKTFEAYRYRAGGDAYSRFYTADGAELEERLVGGPIDSYEQVTSLLRDGRGHRGIDFKTPVGTPVRAPFEAVVRRKNWHFGRNGNCLELEEVGGARRNALFLHLSEVSKELKVGARVRRGDVVAKSGNSGRSFAPHLHYQLEQSGRVVDPFEVHQTHRASLTEAERMKLSAEAARLKALWPPDQLAGG